MIKSALEYQVTQEWIEKFKKSIAAMEQDEAAKNKDFQKWEVNRSALQYHLDKLQDEVAEYERLINSNHNQPIKIKVESFSKLPDSLIKARLASKMTQKELGDILGIDEDKVKKYEHTNYAYASFVEIVEVSTALGVEFESATIHVDFEEIEESKKSAEKWRQWREEKNHVKTKAS